MPALRSEPTHVISPELRVLWLADDDADAVHSAMGGSETCDARSAAVFLIGLAAGTGCTIASKALFQARRRHQRPSTGDRVN